MKPANQRKLKRLMRRSLPQPAPDMTNWTTMERVQWEAEQRGLQAMVRASNEKGDEPPLPKEEADARDARDEAILAERAATEAAEALARDPASLRAERKVRETREAAAKAAKAAEDARRAAEEAKRRPRPPEPAVEPQAVAATPAPAAPKPEADAKPKRARKPSVKKQWWEERAKWTLRAPVDEDERRGRPLYECIHEYDPLAYDEDDESDDL
jgi:hypothetical protein